MIFERFFSIEQNNGRNSRILLKSWFPEYKRFFNGKRKTTVIWTNKNLDLIFEYIRSCWIYYNSNRASSTLIKGIVPQTTTFIITTPDSWQDYEEDLRLLLSPFVKKDHHFIAKTMPKILPWCAYIMLTIKEHKTLTSVIV